jgi:putative salt-induced outer membrane protein YdiY
MRFPAFILILFFGALIPRLNADVITLQNGDRLTGMVLSETPEILVLDHTILGRLEIQKSALADTEEKKKKPEKGDVEWERKIAAGYEMASGNTEYQRLNGEFLVNRNKMWVDEWTFKGNGTVERGADRKLTVQRGETSLRYAYSLSKELYNFYRVSAEHDRFENLNARVLPTSGFGYWFSDTEALKLLTEGGVGYQWEFLRPDGVEQEAILHTRGMISKRLSERVETGIDHYYFPALRDFGNFRMETEAFFRFKISEHLGLKVTARNQYQSRPRSEAKKNDFRLVSGLEYSF